MQAATASSPVPFAQRVTLFALVVALVLAPALANIWPAFGKGEMLYVGETAAAPSVHADHANHADHATHEGHAPATAHLHHAVHCALCVLASLGWAPFAAFDAGDAQHSIAERAAPAASQALRAPLAWRSAQPRAPPFLS
jgi:hypothetical protein